MVRATLKLLSVLLFAYVVIPCVFFGCLGLSGGLSDTSERENFQQGLTFLGIALVVMIPIVIYLVVWNRPHDVQKREAGSGRF